MLKRYQYRGPKGKILWTDWFKVDSKPKGKEYNGGLKVEYKNA